MKKDRKSPPSAVGSDYTDQYADDDLSSDGRGSFDPFTTVLADLEQEAKNNPIGQHLNPTLLQTLGPQKIYLLPQENSGSNNSRCWSAKLLLIGAVLATLAFIGALYATGANPFKTLTARVDSPPTASAPIPTHSPTVTIPAITHSPTVPTFQPTRNPTKKGQTRPPTQSPTKNPTKYPTTRSPTKFPTTKAPTDFPTTKFPTKFPTTKFPTKFPTTKSPTDFPTTNSPTKFPVTEVPANPCSLALSDTWQYCPSPTTLINCQFVNGELVPGDLKECTGDRGFCRCPDGLPFDAGYGCVREKNVNTNCYGSGA